MIDDENCQVAGRKSLMLCVVSFSAHWYSSELSTYAHPVRMSGLTNELPSDLPLTRAASELCRGTGHRLRLCKRHQRVRGAGQAGRRPWHRVLRPLQRCAHMAAEVPCGKPCWDWTCPWMSTRCLRAVSACAQHRSHPLLQRPEHARPKEPKSHARSVFTQRPARQTLPAELITSLRTECPSTPAQASWCCRAQGARR